MVALLGPGIREEDVHLIERAQRNLLLEHPDGVVANDAQVGKGLRVDCEQQSPNARSMDFDAEVIPFRVRCGERRQVLAIAESDLHDPRSAPAEERFKIQRLRVEGDAITSAQPNKGALLCAG